MSWVQSRSRVPMKGDELIKTERTTNDSESVTPPSYFVYYMKWKTHLCQSMDGWVRNPIAPVVPPLHRHGFQLCADILCCVTPSTSSLLRPKLWYGLRR